MDDLTLLLVGALTLVFLFFTTKYTYWRRRNVPGPTPLPILGNYKDFFMWKKTQGATAQDIYQQFPNEPFVGAYYGTEPVLIPRDPEMIKTIMTKDFNYFSGRMLTKHQYRDTLASSNVFMAAGDDWKALRQSFNPMFSTAKLKGMFSLVTDCGKKLETYLDHKYKQSDIQNVKEITTNFTLEVIEATIFGMDFNTLNDEKSTIRKYAYKIMLEPQTGKFVKGWIREIWPNLFYNITSKTPGFDDGVDTFFYELARQSFGSRENKSTDRNDLVDFLLKFKEKGFVEAEGLRKGDSEGKRVKIEASEAMLASQMLVFFAAGFETSASTTSLMMYELAKHPQIQERLTKEIDEVLSKHNGDITYESIQEMKYLDMVTMETLRKYPVLGVIMRECMSNYKFEEYDLKVEKEMRIHIPAWAIHYDPKYYPEPEKFDPERFSPEEVQKRHPYTFLAFGEGHRICIGLRFAKLQVSVALITTLRKFHLERCSQTVDKLSFEPRLFTTSSKEPLQLRLVPRIKS